MEQHGFQPRDFEKRWIVGSNSGLLDYYSDYRWFRGVYTNGCTGNVQISLSEKDEIRVNTYWDPCPDHEVVSKVCIPELVKGIEKFYADYKKKP